MIFPLTLSKLRFKLFLFDKFKRLLFGALKKFVKLGHMSLLLQFFFLFFLKAFYVVDKAFLSNILEFLQLSFGLSVKSTQETERQKVTWWNGTEEFWEKQKHLDTEWQIGFFFLLTFNSSADVTTRYNFNQVHVIFYI